MGSVYGYELASEVPVRRLRGAPAPRGSLRLKRADRPLEAVYGPRAEWIRSPDPPHAAYSVLDTADGLYIAFPGVAAFLVDFEHDTVHTDPPAGPSGAWEHRLLTVAVPLLLAARGDLVLHAAAVVSGDRAVVLAGPAGRGKSTTALVLGRAGHPLLGEDGVVISDAGGSPVVWPGPRGVMVRGGSVWKQLTFVDRDDDAASAVPLGAAVVLDERAAGDLEVERLAPLDALPALAANLAHAGPSSLRAAFAAAARVVRSTPVYRCALPDRLDALPDAAARLMDRLA